jgi:hypothetical protein
MPPKVRKMLDTIMFLPRPPSRTTAEKLAPDELLYCLDADKPLVEIKRVGPGGCHEVVVVTEHGALDWLDASADAVGELAI